MTITTTIHCGPAYPLSRALQENRRAGTLFQLSEGVHEVPGAWAFSDWKCLADGCSIRGAGLGLTTIRLSSDAVRSWAGAPQGDRSLNPLWVGRGCTVEDVTVDGNERAFRNSDPAKAWYVASGIRSIGGELTVRRVRIRGLRGAFQAPGTAAGAIEAFGVSTTDDTVGGNLVEDVEFCGIPARAYFAAVYIGSTTGTDGALPRRSIVSNVRSDVGRGNWFLLAGGCNVEASNLEGKGHLIGVYNDTGSTDAIGVTGFVLDGCDKVVALIDKEGAAKSGVRIINGEFRYVTTASDPIYACELWDQAGQGAELGRVEFEACRFITGRKPLLLLSAVGAGIQPVSFRACELPAGGAYSLHATVPRQGLTTFRDCRRPDGEPYAPSPIPAANA